MNLKKLVSILIFCSFSLNPLLISSSGGGLAKIFTLDLYNKSENNNHIRVDIPQDVLEQFFKRFENLGAKEKDEIQNQTVDGVRVCLESFYEGALKDCDIVEN